MTITLPRNKKIRVTDRELAVLCCLNKHVEQTATLIAIDCGISADDVKKLIGVSRKQGWPIRGSCGKGYTLDLDPCNPVDIQLGEVLELWFESHHPIGSAEKGL